MKPYIYKYMYNRKICENLLNNFKHIALFSTMCSSIQINENNLWLDIYTYYSCN